MIHEVASDLIEESARRIAAAKPADIEAVRGQPGPLIGFSEARDAEHRQMKKFLRTRLYRHEKMQAARMGAGTVLEGLFRGFMADVSRMPPEHRDAALAMEAQSGAAGRARAVADYIAGMTDRYAIPGAPRLSSMTARQEDRVSRAVVPARDRLIFAMDVPSADAARRLADQLGDSITFYKLGLELFTSGGAFELLDWMVGRGKKSVPRPQAVRRARDGCGCGAKPAEPRRHLRDRARQPGDHGGGGCGRGRRRHPGGDGADEPRPRRPRRSRFPVRRRATRALARAARARGRLRRRRVLRPRGQDAARGRGRQADRRDARHPPGREQAGRRPEARRRRRQAFGNGADYIVVGRPIRDAADPRIAAEAIQATIAGLFPRA